MPIPQQMQSPQGMPGAPGGYRLNRAEIPMYQQQKSLDMDMMGLQSGAQRVRGQRQWQGEQNMAQQRFLQAMAAFEMDWQSREKDKDRDLATNLGWKNLAGAVLGAGGQAAGSYLGRPNP